MLASPFSFSRSARSLASAAAVAALLAIHGPLAAPSAASAQVVDSGAVVVGSASVDTDFGERVGRQGLVAYVRAMSPTPPIDADLDWLAREQLRAAIATSTQTGNLAPGLVHIAPDALVRIGVVSTTHLDSRASIFSLVSPSGASAVGSAGGAAELTAPGVAGTYLAEVAAVAWRDPRTADSTNELRATFGPSPESQDELNSAAAQRWVDQENRNRLASNFPVDLLAQRHPVLDREAENTMRRRFGEPELPAVVDPSGRVALDNKIHFTAYACSPNCDPFWNVPDRLVDVYRQSGVENVAARSFAKPELMDFHAYLNQLAWAATLPSYPHYWNSYRTFGVATRVRADRQVPEHRDAARTAVESVAPGGADLWDPREYNVDIVILAYDAWPTDYTRP